MIYLFSKSAYYFLILILFSSFLVVDGSLSQSPYYFYDSKTRSYVVKNKEFNESIITGRAKYEEWMSDPVAVSLKFIGPFEGRKQIIERTNATSESPDTTEVVIINEGLLDDSISAMKFQFTLNKFNNRWIIYSAESILTRCWPGRGHADFSDKPCN